jgi:hypothetical protein
VKRRQRYRWPGCCASKSRWNKVPTPFRVDEVNTATTLIASGLRAGGGGVRRWERPAGSFFRLASEVLPHDVRQPGSGRGGRESGPNAGRAFGQLGGAPLQCVFDRPKTIALRWRRINRQCQQRRSDNRPHRYRSLCPEIPLQFAPMQLCFPREIMGVGRTP